MNEALAGIRLVGGAGGRGFGCRVNQMSLKGTRPIPFRSRVRAALGCAIKKKSKRCEDIETKLRQRQLDGREIPFVQKRIGCPFSIVRRPIFPP